MVSTLHFRISLNFQKVLWKALIVISLLGTQIVQGADSDSSNQDPLKQVLEKPLITGASVSADWTSLSPAKKLALQYTEAEKIKTIAFGGRPGAETIKSLRQEDLADRTSILALDFFFWDSTLPSVDRSLKALKELRKKASQKNVPLVIGEIPELLPGRQKQREKLNKAIRAQCQVRENCFVMPFDRLHKQVLKNGFLLVEGRKLTMKEIVPDGLHLSEPAGQELARRLKAVLLQN